MIRVYPNLDFLVFFPNVRIFDEIEFPYEPTHWK